MLDRKHNYQHLQRASIILEETMGFPANIFLFACIFTFTLWNNIQLSMENEFTAHYSSSFLACVPKSQSRHTTVLDLSQKNISELHISDFSSLPELQVLNLSHNLIRELFFSVFKFNEKLECLDLSHNNLWNMCCQTLAGLKHLDLSFNKFKTLPICQEFGNMLNLEYLGLNATMIRKSDFRGIIHLQLHTVFLTLEDLSHYESKSLIVLNTKNLHIVFPINKNFKLVLFNNLDLSWSILVQIFMIVWSTPVEYFTVKKLTFRGSVQSTTNTDFSLLSYWAQSVYSGSSMKALILDHIRTKVFSFRQDILYKTFSDMNIENLTISDAYMPHILCHSSTSLFQYLDFSYNALTEEVFKNCDTLTHLKMLILQRNQLENLSKESSMMSKMKSLKHLDISRNFLYYDENENHCHWVGTLAKLNLSSNKLTINVQILDLQNNQIRTVPKDITELKALKELNIAFNRLTELPGCTVKISENSEEDTIHSNVLVNYELLLILKKKSHGRLVGWPESYVREYPDGLKGTQLKDFQLSELSCNTTLLLVIAPVVTVVVVAVTSFLCIYFDIMCLHERNFIPGKSIVENIINCIEKSYKSIFVLSPNFVQSEWCHYELYFAHHKLFSESSNSLILILLEPVPLYLIPARYHKLKALMAKRTYLEWPKEKMLTKSPSCS
uniref:TIR domain-containing protein n=1 Tax=Chelonoidis abingdonii TaxID=106734 RepID=A0A8C0HJB7_CHEAB